MWPTFAADEQHAPHAGLQVLHRVTFWMSRTHLDVYVQPLNVKSCLCDFCAAFTLLTTASAISNAMCLLLHKAWW
jgi:hypothetical protein